MEKKTENATKLAEAIAKMRASGLKVTDTTKEGGCIGITGVRKPRELSQAIARLRALGLDVTDKTQQGGGMGFIGGVRKPNEKLH